MRNKIKKSKSLLKERKSPPGGFSPPLFVAVGYVSLFYGCSNFKCIFLSCEMQSFNFPGRELEGLIDVRTHLTIRHIVIWPLILVDVFSLLLCPDSCDQTFPAT